MKGIFSAILLLGMLACIGTRATEESQENILICSAVNGLCNRLRNLASCSVIAEHSGRNLVVCWLNERNPADSNTLGFTQWNELFTKPELKLITKLPDDGVIFGGKTEWESPKLIVRHEEKIPSLKFNDFDRTQSHSSGAENQIEAPFHEPVVILQTIHNVKPAKMSDEEFYERKRAFYQQLVPIPFIADAVKKISSQFPENIVGVHIRSTDMMRIVHQKDYPSLGKYIAAMDEEINRNPNVAFFVSADFLPLLKYMRKYFGKRIYCFNQIEYNNDGTVKRNSVRSTQLALIDLLLLSKTKKLIGTKYSSFSYEAACIGGIPIITEIVH